MTPSSLNAGLRDVHAATAPQRRDDRPGRVLSEATPPGRRHHDGGHGLRQGRSRKRGVPRRAVPRHAAGGGAAAARRSPHVGCVADAGNNLPFTETSATRAAGPAAGAPAHGSAPAPRPLSPLRRTKRPSRGSPQLLRREAGSAARRQVAQVRELLSSRVGQGAAPPRLAPATDARHGRWWRRRPTPPRTALALARAPPSRDDEAGAAASAPAERPPGQPAAAVPRPLPPAPARIHCGRRAGGGAGGTHAPQRAADGRVRAFASARRSRVARGPHGVRWPLAAAASRPLASVRELGMTFLARRSRRCIGGVRAAGASIRNADVRLHHTFRRAR